MSRWAHPGCRLPFCSRKPLTPQPVARCAGAAFQKTAKTASAVAGVKGKLSAFENKAKEAEAAEPTRTTTWRVGGGQGQYKPKTKIGGGPAPKKGFADLP